MPLSSSYPTNERNDSGGRRFSLSFLYRPTFPRVHLRIISWSSIGRRKNFWRMRKHLSRIRYIESLSAVESATINNWELSIEFTNIDNFIHLFDDLVLGTRCISNGALIRWFKPRSILRSSVIPDFSIYDYNILE